MNNKLYGVSPQSRGLIFHWGRRYLDIYYTNFTKRKNKTNRIRWRAPDEQQCEYELTHTYLPLNNFLGYVKK